MGHLSSRDGTGTGQCSGWEVGSVGENFAASERRFSTMAWTVCLLMSLVFGATFRNPFLSRAIASSHHHSPSGESL